MTASAYTKQISCFRAMAAGSAALLLAGCSTVSDANDGKKAMLEAYCGGRNQEVVAMLDEKLAEPRWYNASAVNTGDEIMWRLEAGSMNFALGKYRESIAEFTRTEELIADYDDRALINLRAAAAESTAALTNQNALPYRGFSRDRIALSFYKALAYLGCGDENAFRAQLRRLRSEQKLAQEKFEDFSKSEAAGLQSARKQNPAAAGRASAFGTPEKMANDPRNTEFASGMAATSAAAARGYGAFLNPAALFLSGLGSLRDGNADNAVIDFRRICEAMPQNPLAQRLLATALHMSGRPVPPGTEPFDFPLDRSCLYIILANGRSATLRQTKVSFPIMAAWPVCEFHPAPYTGLRVTANGRTYSTMPLADMDAIMAQEFSARLPGIISRTVLNTLIKEGAYYTALAVVAASDMDSGTKAIALSSVAVAGAAYRAAMNTADTRSWEILPKEFLLAVLPMPPSRKITLDFEGALKRAATIDIPPGCDSAIVFVNAPGEKNVSWQLLPLPFQKTQSN